MHPALSVIVFSTLSGAGYGLIVLVALATLAGAAPARVLLVLLPLALALVTAGLLSSVAHLGKPLRAWRAFSQWRSSWLSREGVLAVATYVPVLALGASLLPQALVPDARVPVVPGNAWAVLAAVFSIAGALGTVACTAMIYASLKPVPAWRHRLVLPGYAVLALLTGAALFAAGLALAGVPTHGWTALVGASAVAAVALKRAYWRSIDASPLPASRADAVGLPGRAVAVFEAPHTQANYLTREMGFVLARKHAQRLRAVVLLLCGGLPLLGSLLAWLLPATAPVVLVAAAASALLGTLVERWLFFAQARHLVTLYY